MSQKLLLSIIMVSGISIAMGTTDLYLPSLPSMARYFGVSEEKVQFTIAAYFAGTALVPFLYGYLADQKGRRFATLFGFSIFILGSLLCVLSPNLDMLTGGRFLQGAGGAAVSVAGFAAIRDLYTKEESARIMAYNGMAIAITPALAPVLGGYIEVTFGWRYSFILILSLAIGVLFLMTRFYKETMDLATHTPDPRIFNRYVTLLKSGRFLAVSLIYPPLFGAIFCWVTISPFYMIEVIGLSPDVFGIYGMFIVAGYPLGAFCNSRLIPRIGLEKTLSVGLGVCVTSCALLIYTYVFHPLVPELLCFDMALFVAGMGIVFATSTTLSLNVFTTGTGSASAVLHMFRMGGAAIGSYAGGVLEDHSLKSLILYMLASAGFSVILFLGSQKNKFLK